MKKALIIPFLLLSFIAFSQESKDYIKYKDNYNYRKGYVLSLDSVKVEGLVKDLSTSMDESRIYSEVVFIPKNGKKAFFTPTQLIGYGYGMFKFFSFGNYFYEQASKGSKVELYKRIVSSGSVGVAYSAGGMPTTYSRGNSYKVYYVKKPNEVELTEVKKKNFDEVFSAYFEECEKLREKISTKQLTEKDITKIVFEYNWCNHL